MNQAINNIKKLPHVSGVCVYDTKHQLVVNSAPAIFSTKDLANIGELLTDITFQARNKLPLITDLLLQYEGVSLIVRNTSDRTMLVLGSPEMNERMVSHSLNGLAKVTMSEQPEQPAASPVITNLNELKHQLSKVMGPMAEIIFDDTLEQWQQKSDLSVASFLQILSNDLANHEQFTEYLLRIEKIIPK